MSAYTFKHLSELPQVQPESILSQTLCQDQGFKVTLFSFAAGQELSQHTASKPVLLHILQGQARLGLAEDSLEAKTGDWLHIPAHLPHSVQALSELHFTLTLLKQAQ